MLALAEAPAGRDRPGLNGGGAMRSRRRQWTRMVTASLVLAGVGVVLPSPAAAGTVVSRPNGDVTVGWQVKGGGSTAWQALDDPVTQPASVDATDYLWAGAAGR